MGLKAEIDGKLLFDSGAVTYLRVANNRKKCIVVDHEKEFLVVETNHNYFGPEYTCSCGNSKCRHYYAFKNKYDSLGDPKKITVGDATCKVILSDIDDYFTDFCRHKLNEEIPSTLKENITSFIELVYVEKSKGNAENDIANLYFNFFKELSINNMKTVESLLNIIFDLIDDLSFYKTFYEIINESYDYYYFLSGNFLEKVYNYHLSYTKNNPQILALIIKTIKYKNSSRETADYKFTLNGVSKDLIYKTVIKLSKSLDDRYLIYDFFIDELIPLRNYLKENNLESEYLLLNFYINKDLDSFKLYEEKSDFKNDSRFLKFISKEIKKLDLILYLNEKYGINFKLTDYIFDDTSLKNNFALAKTINKKLTLSYLTDIFIERINTAYRLQDYPFSLMLIASCLKELDYKFPVGPEKNPLKLFFSLFGGKSELDSIDYSKNKLPFVLDETITKKSKYNYNTFVVIDSITHQDKVITVYQDKEYISFSYIDGEISDFVCSKNKSHNQINCLEFQDFIAYNNQLKSNILLDEKYNSSMKSLKETRNKKLEKEEREITEKLFNSLIAKVNQITPPLYEKIKVNLFADFNITDLDKIETIKYVDLFLKVGTTKDYVVKDYPQFLGSIVRKETVSYGKSLEFNHDIDNFDSNSKLFLSSILAQDIYINDFKTPYCLKLPLTSLYNILSSLVEYTFNISSQKNIIEGFRIYPTAIEAELYLNEEGNLTSSLVNDSKHLYVKDILGDLYLIDYENKFFSKISFKDKKSQNIHEFLLVNKKFVTRHIIGDVVDKILPVIQEDVFVSPVFKQKYPIKEFLIESYLSTNEKKEIILETKIFSDSVEIKNPLNEHQTGKFIRYNKIIESFGFEKNKIKDLDLVGKFLTYDLSELKKVSTVFITEDLARRKPKAFPKITTSVSVSNGLISSHIVDCEFTDAELAEIIRAVKRNKKFVVLENNVINIEKDQNVKQLVNYVDDFNLDEKALTKTQKSPLYNIFKFENLDKDTFEVNSTQVVKNILSEIKDYKNNKINIPDNYKNTLRTYQVEGINWLYVLSKFSLGGILADDMGLGKTIQAICLIELLEENSPILILCPKSLVYNWKKEFEKFHSQVKCHTIEGNKIVREEVEKLIDNNKKEVFIISFDSARNDSEILETFDYNLIILDEAQNIKNINAQKTKFVKKLKASKRLVLTGTPIENAISDLWSIFDFLMPDYLSSYDDFKLIERRAVIGDKDALEYIIKKTSPFILRRNKKDVLKELPDKIEEIIYTPFKDENQIIYNKALFDAKQLLKIPQTSKIVILSQITKLREICISPELIYETNHQTSEKIEQVIDLIEEALTNNHKLLLFSSFVKGLDLVSRELERRNIPYYMLTGSTSASDRSSMAESFNGNSIEKVFLISLKAGGTGLNLTGADIVIHLDPWWNFAAENQASDRAHRIGQTKTVHVYKVVILNSIEERVVALQNAKKELSDAIIQEGGESISNLSIDDYAYLLE